MKRSICLFSLAFLLAAALTASPPSAESGVFIGEWQGGAGDYEFNIVFMYDNTCIITVTTEQNGREIKQDAYGSWSCDKDIIRINGTFSNPEIKGLKKISWKSVYTFNNGEKSAFSILVAPPDSKTLARITFERIMRWIDEK
jgi:hypothetical protein